MHRHFARYGLMLLLGLAGLSVEAAQVQYYALPPGSGPHDVAPAQTAGSGTPPSARVRWAASIRAAARPSRSRWAPARPRMA